MSDKKYVIYLAAGGTGGHIFPAQALGDILTQHGYKVIFITDKRHDFLKDASHVEKIDILPLAGNIIQMARGLRSLVISYFQVRKLYQRDKPKALVTFGGYTTLPAMLVGIKSTPIIVHEQNAVLGKMNRLIASVAKFIVLTYENTSGIPKNCNGKIVVTGNPVRHQVKQLYNTPYPQTDQSEKLNILVIGGSQGARILSNVLPQALGKLTVEDKKHIYIEQQCRAEDVDRVTKIYSYINVAAHVTHFFDDIGSRLSKAHLVISRAGASFLAELTTIGRPAILVPFAKASDQHQLANANHLKEKQAAIVLEEKDFTADHLAEYIQTFIYNRQPLEEMSKKALEVGRIDAGEQLAKIVENTIHKINN